MTTREAIAFIKRHGVVLASAKGPVPRLTEAITGEAIKGFPVDPGLPARLHQRNSLFGKASTTTP